MWRIKEMVGLAATAVLLSGCLWTQVGYGPEHRRTNPVDDGLNLAGVDTLTELWSSELPGAGLSGTDTEAIVADGRVYVGRSLAVPPEEGGGIYASARDVATGDPVWDQLLISGNAALAWPVPMARSGDTVSAGYMGLIEGRCAAGHAELDPTDGSGTITTDNVHVSPAVTSGATAVRLSQRIGDAAGSTPCQDAPATVRARNVTTGAATWALSMGPSLGAFGGWYSSFLPTIADGRVFVAWGPRLLAFPLAGCGAPTCQPTWTATLGADISGTVAPVVTNGGQVLVVTQEGELVSLAASNGAVRWRSDLGWESDVFGLGLRPSIAVDGDVAYVTTAANNVGAGVDALRAFAANGCGTTVCAPLWTAPIPDAPGSPAVTGGVVYVGTNGAVQAYDAAGCGAATCAPVGEVPVTGFALDLTIADGVLYATGSGRVTALGHPG